MADGDPWKVAVATGGASGIGESTFNKAGIVGAIGPINQTPRAGYDFSTAILLRGVYADDQPLSRRRAAAGAPVST